MKIGFSALHPSNFCICCFLKTFVFSPYSFFVFLLFAIVVIQLWLHLKVLSPPHIGPTIIWSYWCASSTYPCICLAWVPYYKALPIIANVLAFTPNSLDVAPSWSMVLESKNHIFELRVDKFKYWELSLYCITFAQIKNIRYTKK